MFVKAWQGRVFWIGQAFTKYKTPIESMEELFSYLDNNDWIFFKQARSGRTIIIRTDAFDSWKEIGFETVIEEWPEPEDDRGEAQCPEKTRFSILMSLKKLKSWLQRLRLGPQ